MQTKFPLLAALLGLLAAFPAHAQTEPQSETVKAWKAGLSAHIASNRFFPVGARGQTGKARVTFVIDRSGTLISRALAESAGSRSLDDAALAIIARAEPFPAPPSELKEDSFPFTVQIVFSGRQFQVPPLGVVLSRPDPASTDPASTEADPMAAWRKTVTQHVWRHRAFPPEAIGQRGDTGVTFVVDRSGKLISNVLVESTGFAPLDAATLAMVERSVPFPKPPAEAKDDLQRVTVLMSFDGTRLNPGPSPEREKLLKSWIEDQARLNAKSPGPDDTKLNSMLRSICRGC
ncbi:energy transducer TonB family protein [Bradyrhizobium sp. 482_C4_N1_1]|jgi:protein TonB|uniref:energy transducer TonB family protein n=1 Tax=Bradyrhizobium TaxID=374 RepID=UPI0007C93942|nr:MULTISPECIES: energy transducer TonB [Bradyrhizobium]WFT94894.1 energy transducer TonB [Bradyrhizobium barranii]